uniref:Cytochrome-b5 reductase n=1 Tax=Acrobeloides nanus TaxID=290746 RepID=A0A914CIR2_9BILA
MFKSILYLIGKTEKNNLNFLGKHKFEVNFSNNNLQITFDSPKVLIGCDKIPSKIARDPAPSFYKYRIEKIDKINHDCFLYRLVSPDGIYCPIPLGHHVIARLTKKGNVLTRPYTPISAKCLANIGKSRLEFLIKIYQDGIFTPELVKLQEGDVLELSEPNNRVNIEKLSDESNVVMLAAGSGITPMVRILQHRHAQKRQSTLFFFNRKRIDLIGEALFNLSFDDTLLVVKNVFSDEQDVSGDELRGRVRKELLEENLSTFKDTQFFVCGPEGFNIAAVKSLEECGVDRKHIHIFC